MKKIVLLFVVLMTVVFLSVLHPENTVKARDDRPVEKTTEEIVKEIRRTGTSVTLQEDGSEIEFEYDPFTLEYAKDEDIAKWVEERRNKVPAELSVNAVVHVKTTYRNQVSSQQMDLFEFQIGRAHV